MVFAIKTEVICAILTCDHARQLIQEGVATGGMQAKLEAAMDALAQRCSARF